MSANVILFPRQKVCAMQTRRTPATIVIFPTILKQTSLAARLRRFYNHLLAAGLCL